ncbi:MAG: glycosyltransferase [Victivallaceae bacterium]|nr:glycosyltransferase [Victivallaceae bacterium]
MNKLIKGLSYIFVFAGLTSWLLLLPGFSISGFTANLNTSATIAFFFIVMNMVYYLFIIVTSLFYRPVKPLADEELPEVTVIVPAYNEGYDVVRTIDSVVSGDYPREKLRIIAIDDGSADDTWQWICKAAEAYPDVVTTMKHPHNCGKRRALYNGFMAAKSEFLVSVDSDSTISANALRAIVTRFIKEPRVGGVAGYPRVSNLEEGILPRMLDVGFVFAFELIRSSQSVFHGVFCTPGALSGYRRSALLPVLDAWVDEKFFGVASGIGEDRALSTALLRDDHWVVFERNAVTMTKMPTAFKNVCKVFLRWGRGDLRETIKMYTFIFHHFSTQRMVLLFNMLMQTIWVISPFFWVSSSLMLTFGNSWLLAAMFLFSVLFWASIPAALYALRSGIENAIWAYSYALFYALFMFWLMPYSLFSINNSQWGTRGAAVPVKH